MPFDILIFAAIAAFFVWKLRQVLGQKSGDERERPNQFTAAEEAEKRQAEIQKKYGPQGAPPATPSIIDGEAVEVQPRPPAPLPQGSLASAIAGIKAADPSFDERRFISGARTAFTMIVESFAKGDTETLKGLLKPSVYAGFETEIERRKAAGETASTTIQRLLAADIANVRIDGKLALVTVDFTSEQLSVTRNAQGEVIDGDPKKPEHVAESWTFERDTASSDPTWFLVSTRTR